ncbi:MAG TPA: serine hydrolase, partial [Ktedonobacterales bacterium]
ISLWKFLNQPAVAPDGWERDFGHPLTEALPVTVTDADGTTHHELVQAFWQTIFIIDADTLDDAGGPTIQRASIGQDYLATFGLPAVQATAGASAWVSASTVARGTPATTGAELAHLGQYWPLTLKGPATWTENALWYQVSWPAGNRSYTGWIPAVATTSAEPAKESIPMAGMDALSHDLNAYLAHLNGTAGVAIYDVTRNQWYSFDGDHAYIMGSSAKVPIMLAYLTSVERQGRGRSDVENWWLTTMIENSNNDSAQVLFDTLGGDDAIIAYLRSIGISTSIYHPNPEGWGWATFSPNMMVRLLTLLYQNKILTPSDRGTALQLLKHVESDQRFGVGDTAPAGATVYMKDGWVIGPEGTWDANSHGIVTIGHETYIISVYTTGQTNLDTSYDILRHICRAVVPLLS